MRAKFCVLLFLYIGLCTVAYGKNHRRANLTSNPVHGYYRKNGTYVQPHRRSLPGYGKQTSHGAAIHAYHPPQVTGTTHPRKYASGYMAEGVAPHATFERDSHGRIKRSAAAKDAFKHEHPCPSTGKGSGACPGYVIDHVNPLECGGADASSNMQWQTIADGKAKDKTEKYCR